MKNSMNKVRLFIIKNKLKKLIDDQRQFFFLESIRKKLGDKYCEFDPFDEEIFENIDDIHNELEINKKDITIKELIEKLEKCNPDKVVIFTDPEGISWDNIKQVIETESNVKITMDGKRF